MSSLSLPTSLNNARLDTYTRDDGQGNTAHVQAVVAANPFPTFSGNLAAAAAVVVATDLKDACGILVTTSGTFSGTVVFEASIDGTTWYTITMVRASGQTSESSRALTGTTLEGWRANISGWLQFRVRCSAYTSGTANINIIPTAMPFEGVPTLTATLGATTNVIGDVGLQVRANATGASTIHHIVSAASTGAAVVKASAGRVLGWSLSNMTASWRYVKLHNQTTAPTAGSGVVLTIGIPPNSTVDHAIPQGIAFATGIGRTTVTGAADADATAVAANDIVGDIYYA